MELPNREPFYLIHNQQLSIVDTQYSGIVKSNAVPYSLDEQAGRSDKIGIFPTLSRINHSCHPNSHQAWSSALRAVTLHALKDIEANEEITVSYIPEARIDIEYLRNKYSFTCSCEFCFTPLDVRAQSNSNREEIDLRNRHLRPMIKEGISERDRGLAMLAAKQLFILLRAEKIVDWRLGRHYMDCFDIVADQGDKERGKIFAALAFHVFDHCEGLDSDNVEKVKAKMEKLFGSAKTDGGFLEWMENIGKEWNALKQSRGPAVLDWLFWKEIWPEH